MINRSCLPVSRKRVSRGNNSNPVGNNHRASRDNMGSNSQETSSNPANLSSPVNREKEERTI